MKKHGRITRGECIFQKVNIVFMIVMMLVMLYPLIYVLMASLSDAREFASHQGLLVLPKGFSMQAYKLMLKNPMITIGFQNTFIILAFSLVINMVMTSICAYVLSRKGLMLNTFFMIIILFTMYFSGGMIPTYLNIQELGLYDSLWALIIPGAINTFNMIVLRTAFSSIPDSLLEAAKLDGASDLTVLVKVILPLSKATLLVVLLYYAVDHWNGWFNAMIYLQDKSLYPLQLVLQEILIINSTTSMVADVGMGDSGFVGETIKYAVIIVSVVPILCVYPVIQKHFEKGVMIGAIKG